MLDHCFTIFDIYLEDITGVCSKMTMVLRDLVSGWLH